MGFVLAGGSSSRMGTDKAFLVYGGRSLLERALETVTAVCGQVAIVGDPEKFARSGSVIPDAFPGCGPLAGIHAALQQSRAELNLILAVDMPFVPKELLAFLLNKAEVSSALAVVPHTSRGWQPLCAIYRRGFANHAEQALQDGKYKIDALFDRVTLRSVEEAELSAAGFSESVFRNLNTPEDLAAAGRA